MKNQVENNQQDKNRLIVPLGQTIFLPQTAMGVSYIDKVRTKVYLDTVQPQGGAVCMRGFYEIDLEYHGLEGNRLYKHRVMLPLCAELPASWNYEPEELHVVITKPMLRILSPYVLEFAAGLAVEYVGERLYREDKPKNHAAETMSQEKTMQETEVRQRLESKFGSPDKPKKFSKPDYHLPVWSEQKPEVKTAAAEKSAEKASETISEKAAETISEKAAETMSVNTSVKTPEPNKLRSMLTVAAISRLQAKGEVLAEKAQNEVQEVILLSPPLADVKPNMPVNVQVVPPQAEPVSAKAEPPQAEPVSAKAEPPQVEPVSAKAEPPQAEPVSAKAEPSQAEPVSAKAEPSQAEPVSAKAEPPQAEPVSAKAEPPQAEPVSAKAEPPQIEPVSAETEPAAEPVLKTERSVEQTLTAENTPQAAETAAETPVVETLADTSAKTLAETVAETPAVQEVTSDKVLEEETVEVAASPDDLAADLAAEVSAAALEAEAEETAAVETAAMENGAAASITNADGVRLRVGLREPQRIRPVPKAAAAEGDAEQKSSSFCLKYYVVKPGDDPMSIALKHNVPLERLRESNKALAGDLSVGTVLRIPV